MIARIKNVFKQWRSNRQHLRELTIKLEALTDPTFLDRAMFGEKHMTVNQMFEYAFRNGKL